MSLRALTKILSLIKKRNVTSFLRPCGDYKLSNALTEHINGTIGTYLSVSRGITNFERFRKRVLFSLNPKINYSLTSHLKNDSLKNKPRGPYNKVKE
ncbi:MAG: transposase [Solobacterium sp.]|nr:transposase [Solobacterium sp.]